MTSTIEPLTQMIDVVKIYIHYFKSRHKQVALVAVRVVAVIVLIGHEASCRGTPTFFNVAMIFDIVFTRFLNLCVWVTDKDC